MKKLIRALGVLLAMFAVMWIITGSTVVFHQKYVYHNLLTQWQDMILKTGAKETKKYIKYIEKNPHGSAVSAFAALTDGDPGRNKLSFTRYRFVAWYAGELQTPEYIAYQPPRGPPVL